MFNISKIGKKSKFAKSAKKSVVDIVSRKLHMEFEMNLISSFIRDV